MTDYLSKRAKRFDASGIRKIWQKSASMTNPVNFSIGQPDFDVPQPAKDAAIKAIQDGYNGYTLTKGISPLITAISDIESKRLGWEKPSVMITSGVSGSLNLLLATVIDPLDEVLIPDPYFVMYNQLTNMNDGKCVYIDTYPDFKLSAQKIQDAITDKTKLLLLNSPGNPSGSVYQADELKAVADIARKHNLLVLSDEIYRDFSYDGPCASIASYYENTIVTSGFSKAYGAPGWRLGYIAVPEHMTELLEKMATIQQYSFVCAPHPFQIGAIEALKCDISKHVDAYRIKRNLIFEGLKDTFGLVKPAGAFYAFVPAPGGDATKFIDRVLENNVVAIPGNAFSQRDTHFRISYATSDEMIQEGIKRLCKVAREFE